jgi:hypothetical protein
MAGQLSESIILAAIDGFEAQKIRIDQQIAELRTMLRGRSTGNGSAAARHKRTFSPEALQRMREAQQRRWAKVRGTAPAASATGGATKPRRRLTAAGRRAISQAAKRRWALKRAAAKKAQPIAVKKPTLVQKRPASNVQAKKAAA